MKPIRTTMLAALTAAIAIAPLASADAHKRHHRHGDVAAAIALGLFTAGVISRANRHHHRHIYRYGRNCYGLPRRAYHRCKTGRYYGVPHGGYHPYGGGPYPNGINGGGHFFKNGR